MRHRPLALLLIVLALVTTGCDRDPAPPSVIAPGVHGFAAPAEPIRDPVLDMSPPPADPWAYPHEDDRLVVEFAGFARLSPDYYESRGTALEGELGEHQVLRILTGEDPEVVAARFVGEDVESVEPATIYYTGNEMILGYFEGDQPPPGMAVDETWPLRCDLASLQAQVEGVGVTVAILDSGVDPAGHPTLGAVLEEDEDWDFVDGDDDPQEEGEGPARGHGTLVADLVHQVAPQARILVFRVMNAEGVVRTVDVTRAIRRILHRNPQVRVINLSLGGRVAPRYLESALADAWSQGVAIIASVGNTGGRDDYHYPSSSPHVCGVAATDAADQRAGFSSYGLDVLVAAPGHGLAGQGAGGGTVLGVGTSFAAPLVSGAVAARLQRDVGLDPPTLFLHLENTGLPLDDDYVYRMGLFGRRLDFQGFLAAGATY